MIVDDHLRAWASDRERQRAAREAADTAARSWNQGPAHRRFEAAMEPVDGQEADRIVEAVRALFSDDLWVDQLISGLAHAMRDDPFFEPPFRHINSDIHKGLVVYEDDKVSIAAGVTHATDLAARKLARRGRTSIAFSGQVSLFKFVRSGGACLSFWRAPTITADFNRADAGRCEPAGRRTVADGEIIVVDGRSEGFVIEHASANLVILQATAKAEQAPLAVEYDSHDLEFVGCSAADDSASRIQMITTLIRKLGHVAAYEVVESFLDHPAFFVRWHVMRELIGLDAGRALPRLKQMAARDPHKDTRRVARATLERFEAGELTRKAA